MEQQPESIISPARAAATVLMLRDGPGGLEVFLLKRHSASDVLGGAYVFPGGKVDPEDSEPGWHDHLDLPAETLRARLQEADLPVADALALHVAAMRELFEESGVLYVAGAGAGEAAEAAARLRNGASFFSILCETDRLLETSRMIPWSRWITPATPGRKRFDARFFLAPVPPTQEPRHDDLESTDCLWATPREALLHGWERTIELAPPQIMSLVQLSRHRCVADALAAAGKNKPALIQPHPFEVDGGRVVCYPGHERHPVRERALQGPTHLQYRNRRYEAAGGSFDDYFRD
jgi:8-oxo-dGTP pyrophosphatase MutT (NUDIX family)